MKLIKKLLLVLVLVFAVTLTGCGTKLKIDNVQLGEKIINAINDYSTSDHCNLTISTTKDGVTDRVSVAYNYKDGAVDTLKSVLVDNLGELSVYIKDGKSYINRYNTSKTVADITPEEALLIAEQYNAEALLAQPMLLFTNSFFKYSTVTFDEDYTIKAELTIIDFEISEEEESDELNSLYDKIKEKESVSVEAHFTKNKELLSVSVYTKTMDLKDVSFTIEFKECAKENINIEFPDFSEYK